MKIYIYLIYFPTSKRPNPHYVGVSNNLERRMFQHLENSSLVGNALDKYDDWIIKKLHTCKTYEEAFRIEIEEIRNFNCVAPNGYNLTAGGEGLFNPSEETREKMSKNNSMLNPEIAKKQGIAQRGIQAGEKNSMYGRHHSEESKEKIRQTLINTNCNLDRHYNSGKNNPMFDKKNPNAHSTESEIKRLKTRIKKLDTKLE